MENEYHMTSYAYRKRETIRASLFGAGLFACVVFSFIVAFNSMDSVILGTELNANGMVEYLCLGADCENLQNMNW